MVLMGRPEGLEILLEDNVSVQLLSEVTTLGGWRVGFALEGGRLQSYLSSSSSLSKALHDLINLQPAILGFLKGVVISGVSNRG
jgi:hypothetical protein